MKEILAFLKSQVYLVRTMSLLSKNRSQNDKTELFARAPVPRAVMTMALPAIFSQIIILIYNMADTYYLGQTNNAYMVAGVSLILPVFNLSWVISGLTGVGGGTLISRLLGLKQEEQARKVCSFSLLLALFLAACYCGILFIFSDPILKLLGASPNTYTFAWQYMFLVLVLGGIPTVLSNVMANLARSTGLSLQAGIGITMGGVLNIFLDPLFMFVLLPKEYEVLGVGIATLISNTLAFLYFLYLLSRKENLILNLHLFQGFPTLRNIWSIFAVGVPSSIATMLFDVDYAIVGRLMAAYGDYALAAIGIVLKVERLPLNVGIGICQGMLPIVAYNFSARNFERMKKTISFSLMAGVSFSLVSLALYEIFSPLLVELFIRHPETLAYGTDFLRVRSLATLWMFLSFFILHLFQGFDKGGIALFLGVFRWLVLNIPMLYLLNSIFGMMGIVWSQVIADSINVAVSLLIYTFFSKKHFSLSAQPA